MNNPRGDLDIPQPNLSPDSPDANNLYIPVNSRFDSRPVYVNPKQYNAILKRRMKKIKKNLFNEKTLIKKRNKSVKRSMHAKNRKRDATGKFSSRRGERRQEESEKEEGEKKVFHEKGEE